MGLVLILPAPVAAQELPPPTPDVLLAAEPPEVSAATWMLFDDTFGRVLATQRPDARRAIASTTKIMTALVALEEASLTDLVEISDTPPTRWGSPRWAWCRASRGYFKISSLRCW